MKSGVQLSSHRLKRCPCFRVWMRWKAECNKNQLLYLSARRWVWMRWKAECNEFVWRNLSVTPLKFECDEKRSATRYLLFSTRTGSQVWMRWKAECNGLREAIIRKKERVWMRWKAECNTPSPTPTPTPTPVWMRWKAECNSRPYFREISAIIGLNAMKSGVQPLVAVCIN